MAKPWFDKWVWADWKTDAGVRRCSAKARALWFELLGDMFIQQTDSVGGTTAELSRACGCLTPEEVAEAVVELQRNEVCCVTERNGEITLVSRRRRRERNHKDSNALRQSRHRAKRPGNGKVTQEKLEVRIEKLETTTTKPRKRGVSGSDVLVPPDLQAHESVIREWFDYRMNRKPPIYDLSLQAHFDELRKFGTDLPAVLKKSIANGWQGLFPLKSSDFSGKQSQKVSQEYARG